MNAKAPILAALTAGVAIVTLVVLNLVAPISHAQEAQASGVSADQVFAASIAEAGDSTSTPVIEVALAQTDEPGEPAADKVAAAVAPASGGGACTQGVAHGSETVVAMAKAAEPAAAPTAPAESAPVEVAQAEPAPVEVAQAEVAPVEAAPAEAPPVEAAPVEEPAPVESAAVDSVPSAPASAGGACSTGVTASGEKPVVVMAGGVPDDAAAVDATPSPAPKAADKPKPVVVADAGSEPQPAKSKPKPAKPKAPPAVVKKAWWPAQQAGKLNITYGGEASFTKAIVLLFDGTFDSPDSANQNVVVKKKGGDRVKGQWLVATNRQMLLFNVGPGLYTVEVGAGLTDKGGRVISAASSGPVFVP
ncbi:MAG: hypothetical protein ACT4QA_00980 [Panacagrimonas sp.]